MANWHDMLSSEMESHAETRNDIIGSTLTDAEMLTEFQDNYGGIEGAPFTVWTRNRVYFPACYDGCEWVASVPRNPNEEKTHHIGGG